MSIHPGMMFYRHVKPEQTIGVGNPPMCVLYLILAVIDHGDSTLGNVYVTATGTIGNQPVRPIGWLRNEWLENTCTRLA